MGDGPPQTGVGLVQLLGERADGQVAGHLHGPRLEQEREPAAGPGPRGGHRHHPAPKPPTTNSERPKKVAFICVHNSCRSQIAEALGKHLASDVFESYSAGTETKPQINQDAVRIMKELYGIDMEKTQYSKLISDIPAPDIAISMGCNVGCPFIGRAFDDNWGLEDPTGSEDQVFVEIIREIEKRILQLKQSLI